LIGDYNIGGDVWSVKPLLEECGLNVKATWTGDGEIEKIAATHKVKLAIIHCYRSMKLHGAGHGGKYSIPWIELNFFGPTKIRNSLRKLAERFDDRIKGTSRRSSPSTTPSCRACSTNIGHAWRARR